MSTSTRYYSDEDVERSRTFITKFCDVKLHPTVYVLIDRTGDSKAWMRFFVVDYEGKVIDITVHVGRITELTNYDRKGKWYLRTHATNAREIVGSLAERLGLALEFEEL